MIKILKIARHLIVFILGFVLVLILLVILIAPARFVLLGVMGANLTLFGYNETGPEIFQLALEQKDEITGDDLRAFSVQNSKNGNYDVAIRALDQAILKDAEVKGYYAWLLLYYYRDHERSLKLLEEYDALTPGFSDAVVGENINYLKGLALKGMGRNEDAIKEFDKYINESTASQGEEWVDVYTFVNKGIAHSNLGQHEQAIAAYELAIRNYQECTEAYYYKAISLLELQDYEQALDNANKAKELISNGYKHSDPYVELFEEIYQAQTVQLITRIEKQQGK